MTASLYIVILNFNGLTDTRRCLQSLQAALRPGVRVVVVDNGSTADPTPAIAREFPWCEVLRNPINGGWAGGNNVGLRHALQQGAENIILLNNDTTVAPELVDQLRAAADAYPRFAILGPVINFMDEPDEVMTDGCVFNPQRGGGFFQRRPVPLETAAAPVEVDIVNGCCMMIRRATLEQIGLIDERFFLIHEEADFCLRAQAAGARCGVLGQTLVWHRGSTTFKQSGRTWQRYYDARNLHLLLRQHGARRSGRGYRASWLAYYRYLYHRYCLEREAGAADAAGAVVAGLCDAWAGRYGAMPQRRRWLRWPLARLCDLARRARALFPKTAAAPSSSPIGA